MQRGLRATRFESGPNMTPLVDVVMVILIFLMLVGTFVTGEKFVEQKLTFLPSASSAGQPPPAGFVPNEPVTILVSSPTPDTFSAIVFGAQYADRAPLAAALVAKRAALLAAGQADKDLKVIIQAEGNVRFGLLMTVYDAATEAEFSAVSFAMPR